MDIKTLCLAVLYKEDASGYEIKKAFEEGPFSHFQAASFGSIYPSLSQLRKSGLVSDRAQAQDGRPDKKVYSLTEAGRDAFHAALMADPGRDQFRSDLLFLLFFAEQLEPGRMAGMIDDRIGFYRDWIQQMDEFTAAGPTSPGHEFVRGFGRAVYAAAAEYMDDNRDKLLHQVAKPKADAAE
jgi:PadR family transcriptional regulator AphA